MTLYKAVRPDGTSFRDAKTAWAVGETTTHPASTKMIPNDASTYLSASSEPADCTGFEWPCRLFEVEPVGEVLDGLDYPNKRAALAFRVVRELPAHEAFGPNGAAVAAFVERCKKLTPDEARKLDAAGDAALYAAWYAARGAAWYAAWDAAGDAALYAAWYAARGAAGDAARGAAGAAARGAAGALLVKDKITPEQFDTLTKPWRDAGLPL
jgi:hypothetical protein